MQASATRSPVALALAVLVVAVIAVACLVRRRPTADVLTRGTPPPGERIAYGPGPSQFGELRLPPGAGPHPVAIVLHGGCWLARYDATYMTHLAAALTENGIATWNVEYRRLGEDGGGWPGTFTDVARATDYVRVLAERHALDADRVVAVGHSAGGQLALWLAARPRLPRESPVYAANPLPLVGVVTLAGITDLRRVGPACAAEVPRLLGGAPDSRAAIVAQTSPLALLPAGVPAAIVSGDRDGIVPIETAKDYVAAATAKGDAVQLIAIPGAGHFDVVDPRSFAWPEVQRAIRAAIDGTGRSRSRP